MSKRAVITGMGVAAPNGLGADAYWKAALQGTSGIGPISHFDATRYSLRLAGEIRDFTADKYLAGRLLPQTDVVTQLALAASDWALADADLDVSQVPQFAKGTITAASFGGFEYGQRELQNLWGQGSAYVSAYMSFAWFYAVNSGQIAIRNDARGPVSVLVTEQAGALDALAVARRRIRDGFEVMITGGMDSALCPFGWVHHLANERVTRCNDPRLAYLPFDARASGYVPGEGGAILVVEEREAALRRGRTAPYGEIAGYATTSTPVQAQAVSRGCAGRSSWRSATPGWTRATSAWSSRTPPESPNLTSRRHLPSPRYSVPAVSRSPHPRP